MSIAHPHHDISRIGDELPSSMMDFAHHPLASVSKL
jgi:hypothetical protein